MQLTIRPTKMQARPQKYNWARIQLSSLSQQTHNGTRIITRNANEEVDAVLDIGMSWMGKFAMPTTQPHYDPYTGQNRTAILMSFQHVDVMCNMNTVNLLANPLVNVKGNAVLANTVKR